MQSRSLSGAAAALLLGLAAGAGSLVLAASSGAVPGGARPAATDTPLPPLPVLTVYPAGGGTAMGAPTPPAQIIVTPAAGSAAAPASAEAAAAVLQRMMATPGPGATVLPGRGPAAPDAASGMTGAPAPDIVGAPAGDAFFQQANWQVQPLPKPLVWRKYADPNIGFGFDYPADWQVSGAARVEGFDFRKGGILGVSIANYDAASMRVLPLGKAAEFVKIDVSVSFVGAQLRAGDSVQDYLNRVRSPSERLLKSEAVTMVGAAGVLETIEHATEGGSAPTPATSACAIKDEVLYCASLIQFHPSTPNPAYVEVLRQLAARFQPAAGK